MKASRATIQGGEWFTGAGLGMFIHWDHASAQGIDIGWPIVGEYVRPSYSDERITPEQYHASAAAFDPQLWDADALISMAKDGGANYVVFTARHHGGHSMWHSKASDYSIEHTPFGRDIVREYLDAARRAGLRVGLYYSLSDWHHPDYPAIETSDLPYKKEHFPDALRSENAGLPIQTDRHRRSSPEQWSRYLDYVRAQLTELLTEYGDIDLLWFDGDWERSAEEWRSDELRALIKSLQPSVIINERLPEQGDYSTPEQSLPVEAPTGPWEMCLTIGHMWGWSPADTRNKSTVDLLTTLIEVVSRGGNLLLNTNIAGDGSLNDAHVERFAEIGEWMRVHGESVRGVAPAVGVDSRAPITVGDDVAYVHLTVRPVGDLVVRGVPVERVSRVSVMATDQPLDFRVAVEMYRPPEPGAERTGELRVSLPAPTGAPIDVIRIEFAPRESA
jgi:alpha-L-fucosidase